MKSNNHPVKSPLVILAIAMLALVAGFAAKEAIKNRQYKKHNRDQIGKIVKGNPQAALDFAAKYLKDAPDDLESLYIRTMAYSRMNQPDKAMDAMQKALDLGLPFERFLAGPRDLLATLYDHPPFEQLVRQKNIQLLHGPHLGSVTDTRARIWIRTATEVPAAAAFSTSPKMKNPITTKTVTTRKTDDYTAVLEAVGLKPDTEYFYQLKIDGKPVAMATTPGFRTFPKRGTKSKFTIAFGGGAGYTPWYEYMWNTIRSRRPMAFLAMGDNAYIDTPEIPQTQRYCYYRRQSRPEFRAFAASTPLFAIWDDHDFGTNDCTSSLDIDEPEWKLSVLKIFTENWVNPYYGAGPQNPGCYFDMSIADVDFFFLDTRFYRQNPKKIDNPSILGPAQQKWLLEKIKNSTATFKIIASSVPWAPGTKPGSKDTWDGFVERREEIFSFIAENRIEGVVLICADRHRSDAWKIERPGAYPLYDLMSSKLTNVHTHPVLKGALFGYNEKCSVGFLTFDTTKPDPELTYNIVTIDNETLPPPYQLTIRKSELSFQVP